MVAPDAKLGGRAPNAGLMQFAQRCADCIAGIRRFRMKKAGYAVTPLDRVRRNPMKPSAAKPVSNIAQVEGSGTEDVSDTLSAKP